MKWVTEVGSGALTCMPNFTQIGSDIQKLIWSDTQTHSEHCDRISLLLHFQNYESRLNIKGL
jgi:hypothetical protein